MFSPAPTVMLVTFSSLANAMSGISVYVPVTVSVVRLRGRLPVVDTMSEE